MTTQQNIARAAAMIRECNDAASLFSRGLEAARAIRSDYADAVVVMSLLALGSEKMLKLTIGFAALDRGDPWPRKKYMRDEVGHQVKIADQRARLLLDLHAGTARGWLDDLKKAVAQNPVVPAVIESLNMFGDGGRFYFLDVLAETPQPGDSPQSLWTDLTSAIATRDPALLIDLGSVERADRARLRLNETIVDAMTAWWGLYVAAWRTGAVGQEAQRHAHELALPAR
ncbi:hypothetical protein [Actinoplanes sp. NPDC051411]|uniref:hypothetical protein n=1 Tax=Actinoplanes sp. NPDC051411 TaxID=3155522 RepID=UPI0034299138